VLVCDEEEEEEDKSAIARGIYTPQGHANPNIVEERRQRKIMRHACADFGTCFGSLGDFRKASKAQTSSATQTILNAHEGFQV
jgi:hypothetical protein